MPESLLRVENLSKAFTRGLRSKHRYEVLNQVGFELFAGQSLAIVGTNGAGKTTLLKIVASLIIQDSGVVAIGGKELQSRHERSSIVGFATGEERSLFYRLSGRQNLRFFGALYGLRGAALENRIEELSRIFDLGGFLDLRVDRCSSGMRVRLGFARALLHSPRLLLLDEPTKSLDPVHADEARRWMRGWVQEGNAMVFATHLPEEAEALATQVGVLEKGTLRVTKVQPDLQPESAPAGLSKRPLLAGPMASVLWRAIGFLRRDVALQFSYRGASILELAGMLVNAAMMLFFARLVDATKNPYMTRYSAGGYFGFFVTGFALANFLQSSLQRFGAQIRESQVSGNLEALFLSPAQSWELAAWGNLWSFIFQSFKITIYLGIALFLGMSLSSANWVSAILAIVLSIFALAPLGILAAGATLSLKRGDAVMILVTGLSTLMAGVFYPIQVLPWWLRKIALLLPLTHGIDAFRSAVLHGASPFELHREIFSLLAFALVLGPPSFWGFSMAVRAAKRAGSLGQF